MDQWKDISVLNDKQLFSLIRETDVSVPKERHNRKNLHIERWILFLYLSTLSIKKQFNFPLVIKKSESPDFVMTENGVIKGIEITEAINPDILKARSLPESKHNNNELDIAHFRWNEKHTLKSLKEIAKKEKLLVRPWRGNSVEREYAKIITNVVAKKTLVFKKSNFKKFNENILVIYINSSLPILDTHLGAKFCSMDLNDYWGSNKFSSVVAIKDGFVTVYMEEEYTIYDVPKTWYMKSTDMD